MKLRSLSFLFIFVFLLSTSCNREKRNKRAEEKGRAQTEKQASFVKGVGEGLKGVGKDAVESVSEGVGEIFRGANEGFDKSLVKIDIRVAEDLASRVSASRCEIHQNDSTQKKGMLVYCIFDEDFDNKLVLKAFDKDDQELGRSLVNFKAEADNSHFIEFPFDDRTSFTLIKYLTLEQRN